MVGRVMASGKKWCAGWTSRGAFYFGVCTSFSFEKWSPDLTCGGEELYMCLLKGQLNDGI